MGEEMAQKFKAYVGAYTHETSVGIHVYDVDIDHGRDEAGRHPSAVFSIRQNQKLPHTQVLAALADLDGVFIIEEI